ncbi:MAG TPA: efflux RND transporter periplasmic adaptor subunit [Gemmatimonadaceae bacterium]|nr:efflux RND transporter periplasmic adaptor subunit [Gemmatimonadaceae bacterium]
MRHLWKGAAALGLIILVSWGYAVRSRATVASASPAAAPALDVGAENIALAVRGPFDVGPAVSGSLTALHEARLRAEVSGHIVSVLVLAGQRVRRGEAIVRIDDGAIRDAYLSARSGERLAQLALDDAQRDYERAVKLQAAGAVADRDLESAKRALANAEAIHADAQARLSSAQQQLDRTRIAAPFDGVVSDMPVNAGDVVAPGTAIATVIDPASMRFEGTVPAEQVAALRTGAPVRFTVKGYPGKEFTGHVERVSPAADPATRQVRVWVTIPNAEGTLVGGLFAQGRVATTSRTAVTIPLSAVDERGVTPSVMRLRAGAAERVPVTLGVRDTESDRAEVLSGLAAGDSVLIGAAQGVTAGTKVRVMAAPSDRPAGAASPAP